MSSSSQEYADLALDSYGSRVRDEEIALHGVTYKVMEQMDRPSGYQGTIYQCMDTGEIVVAHRGTEFDKGLKDKLQDGALADGGMVLARANLQADDAIELTRRAFKHAEDYAKPKGLPVPEITVTGHSLGGCLAQVTAHHFGLRGETFNAYGAVSLNRRVPAGGDKVLNHVMAADFVSAASPHYGQVRVYATREQVEALAQSGYENNRSTLDLRNPMGPTKALGIEPHLMHNFHDVDGNGRPDRSVLNDPQSRLFAQRYDAMIDKYRNDVQAARAGLTTGARGVPGLADDAIDYPHGPPEEPARRERPTSFERPAQFPATRHLDPASSDREARLDKRTIEMSSQQFLRDAPRATQVDREPLSYLDPTHRDHALFHRIREAMPAQMSDEKVAELTQAAKRGGVLNAGRILEMGISNDRGYVYGPLGTAGAVVDLRTPAPPMAETMRQAETAEQQQVAQLAQVQEQQRQSHERGGRAMA